ncbi:unnamed protein product [Boreogadus saida]
MPCSLPTQRWGNISTLHSLQRSLRMPPPLAPLLRLLRNPAKSALVGLLPPARVSERGKPVISVHGILITTPNKSPTRTSARFYTPSPSRCKASAPGWMLSKHQAVFPDGSRLRTWHVLRYHGYCSPRSSPFRIFSRYSSTSPASGPQPTLTTTQIEKTQEVESCSTLESTVALLRQSLSLQEVELVELKERLNNSSQQQQQLEEQRSLLGDEFRASLLELRGERASQLHRITLPAPSTTSASTQPPIQNQSRSSQTC